MAQENVKLFNEKLMESEELRAKLKAAEEAYTGDKTDREKAVSEIVIPLANEVGLPFTIDELKAAEEAMIADAELDDNEMAAVAGGAKWCFIVGFGGSLTNNWDFACAILGAGGAGDSDHKYECKKSFCIIFGYDNR